jgi:hypothetical protein
MNQPEAEITRAEVTRTLRCPRCRQFFETPRCWSLVCPNCDHEWEETTTFSRRERFMRWLGDAGGHAFFGAMILTAIAALGAVFASVFALFVVFLGWLYGLIVAVCFWLLALSFTFAARVWTSGRAGDLEARRIWPGRR